MSVTCNHCSAPNQVGKFCAECGQPLPQLCRSCGATNAPTAAFCGNCGLSLTAAPQPTPAAPPAANWQGQVAAAAQPAWQPYPPMPGPVKKSPRWAVWLSVIAGILLGLVGILRLISAFSGPSLTHALVAKGTLPSAGQGQYYDTDGSYLVEGINGTANFYAFNDKGVPQRVAQVRDSAAGKLLDVRVGDMYNSGSPVMVAVYERKLYIAGNTGKTQSINIQVQKVLIGDYDGDGNLETIIQRKDNDGKDAYELWRYTGKDSQQIIGLGGRTAPEIYPAHITLNKKDLLLGYTRDNGGLNLMLYTWDNVGGPTPYGKYPMEDKPDAAAFWIAAGPVKGAGAALLVARGGNTPTAEVMEATKSGVTSLGKIPMDGKGGHALGIGEFTGQDPQLLAIDTAGNYFIYNIKK